MTSPSPTAPQSRGALLEEVLGSVRPLVLNSARVLEQMWRPAGVTVGMRAVLGILHDNGPLTVPDVAGRLDLARQGVQRHVNDLAGHGLVESRANPGHRRSVLIAPTRTGRQLYDRMRGTELAQLREHVAVGCTDEELRVAARVLATISHDVRARAQALRAKHP